MKCKCKSCTDLRTEQAGPRDKDAWVNRLKEEYQSLIKYVSTNKEADNDWFRLESNKVSAVEQNEDKIEDKTQPY